MMKDVFEELETIEKMNDSDIYTEHGAEDLVDNGEIDSFEHGFMIGYLES